MGRCDLVNNMPRGFKRALCITPLLGAMERAPVLHQRIGRHLGVMRVPIEVDAKWDSAPDPPRHVRDAPRHVRDAPLPDVAQVALHHGQHAQRGIIRLPRPV